LAKIIYLSFNECLSNISTIWNVNATPYRKTENNKED
jgi:hypothetical protein